MYNIYTVFLREQFFGRKSFDHGIYDNAAEIQSKKNRGLGHKGSLWVRKFTRPG